MPTSNVNFRVIKSEKYTIVHFELSKAITPSELREITPPKIDPMKGIVLSGRGPIWLYCYLAHYYHPTKFVATFDPRLGGAVVTQTHDPEHEVGEIIEIKERELIL